MNFYWQSQQSTCGDFTVKAGLHVFAGLLMLCILFSIKNVKKKKKCLKHYTVLMKDERTDHCVQSSGTTDLFMLLCVLPPYGLLCCYGLFFIIAFYYSSAQS